MARHSSGDSSAGPILTETSGKNSLHQNIEGEDTELLSELRTLTEYSADVGSCSVTQNRTSESATPTSRHYGEGDHNDKTSVDETSAEDSCKHITENMTSSIVEDHKNEAIHSRRSRLNRSVVTRYSSDFEPLSTARTAKSVSSLRYSDDFEPTTNSKTGRSQYTTEYSEDFESVSRAAETTTMCSEDISDVSHSATVSRSETRSQSASTSTSVRDDQADTTDMTQNDVDDTEYSSDLDHSEMQPGSRCSRTNTDSYEQTGASSRPSSCQQTDASHATATNRSTSVEDPGVLYVSVSHTYSSGSDVKYSDDDDFTEYEEEEKGDEEEEEHQEEDGYEEDSEEREAAHQAEVAYVERKLQALKSYPVPHSPLTPHPPPQPRHPCTKNMPHLEEFCSRKLSLLKKKQQQSSVLSGRMETRGQERSKLCGNKGVRYRENARCMYLGLEGSQRVDAHGISSVKVMKLRERHAMGQIRKAAEAKIHIPKKCPACREKLAELAEEEFFRAKTAKMLARLMDQKFEKHLLKYSDTVGLIGELVQELPTMQQTPSEITKQLLQPLENRPSVVTETTPSSHVKETYTLLTDVPHDPSQVWEAYMAPLHDSGWLPTKS